MSPAAEVNASIETMPTRFDNLKSVPTAGDSHTSQQATAPRGRPRDDTRDLAIHEATLALLTDLGYDRLSVGAIAIRAGVSKATIYRRWANKAAVVASAVEHRAAAVRLEPSGASLRQDLLQIVTWLAEEIAEQDLGMVAAVLAGMRSDPDLAAAMRGRLHRDEAAMIERTLHRAAERGEPIASDSDELFAQIAPAVITHRLLIAGKPCDAPFLEHLVDSVLLRLLRAS